MTAAFIGALSIPWFRNYFELPLPERTLLIAAIGMGAIGAAAVEISFRLGLRAAANTNSAVD
jgi:hypothetical protein